ncbi:MAG: hypothetical protein CMH34_07795 [Microbacterium sp.]|jgi:hypothetical protein|nr:hypothetical protein [Microbacterium sp.]
MMTKHHFYPVAHPKTRPAAIGALVGSLLCLTSIAVSVTTITTIVSGHSPDEGVMASSVALTVAGIALALACSLTIAAKTKQIESERARGTGSPVR